MLLFCNASVAIIGNWHRLSASISVMWLSLAMTISRRFSWYVTDGRDENLQTHTHLQNVQTATPLVSSQVAMLHHVAKVFSAPHFAYWYEVSICRQIAKSNWKLELFKLCWHCIICALCHFYEFWGNWFLKSKQCASSSYCGLPVIHFVYYVQ